MKKLIASLVLPIALISSTVSAQVPILKAPSVPPLNTEGVPRAILTPKGTLLPRPLDDRIFTRLYFFERKYQGLCDKTISEQWNLGEAQAKALRLQRDTAIEDANRFPLMEVLGGVGAGVVIGLLGALFLAQ